MVKVLELFSGTGSVSKVCDQLGWDTLSVDIDGRADIKCDILTWDYKQFNKDEFDIIWASPPCATFSALQYSWIGRKRDGKIFTREDIDNNMAQIGDPLAQRTLEIINYFDCEYWFMENPNTGRMKDRPYMKDLPYYIVDYCMYSDWGYRKRTRIWTNKKNWIAKTCDGAGTCGNMIKAESRLKHKEDVSKQKNLDDRYRIPEDLIFSLFLD